MSVGVLLLHFQFPGCHSLKEKRSRLKPLLVRLHREFNISVAEVDLQDVWDETIVACALVSNSSAQAQRALGVIVDWLENNWPEADLLDDKLELL
jgi:hypothetical protein